MFASLRGRLSRDIGIDLGTANTLVFVKDKGIIINEPSVVAVNTRSDQIVAVGLDAQKMLGKTPAHIVVTKPLVDGVISDFEVTEKMLKYFIDRVHRESFALAPRPRVVIGIPLDVTEVERKAVEDAALSAGAREVLLVEEPMAAALGARLPVREASGNLLVDIGGGTTEVAVISLGGVVMSKSMRVAGDELTEAIIHYAREHTNLLIGERTAEEVKMKIGSAMPLPKPLEMKMRGRDLMTGLPREVTVTDAEIREALGKILKMMIENIRNTIENTPPELVADIYERGLIMTGGGALLKNLDKLFSHELAIAVQVIDDPLTAVVRGTGVVLENVDGTRDLLLPSSQAK
ncbi:MAG: rod shape-determining protein MreB [Parcubacteria group bacterium GW2011_GWD2_43_10]|uniref:Cell shape-determining protein MreB n=5 Tax=Candidatus Vebleniibacteriota TaxID=1817921 RepID=A0A1G2Q606_9BACT|nr:MAG: rod shape-determining protein MreB [Parcubacteria group bacterium GW2011_GWA2_42_80]KKS78704.1 MAG: rod shape-determining protein MreB [Parcubacteria group bacterium GW2011_GWD1_42_9]KKS81764.1 MAG: rod shape-determining protein MreB [Parcubacteria group bacterium GW2011_GWD2_43_10]KKS92507.1 MAG: rod shape-determining protein MreB [Parcubacteria group bacterium GW2011_GWE2_43_12]KKT14182.1 MAG: rod shape-determining protein MreB [Parcubacteria group bacterium GW2011_GWA1_43_27]KKT1475